MDRPGQGPTAQAEAELRQATSKTTLTGQQIQNLIEECADIASDLRDGDPGEMAGAYRKLGLRLTYHPERHLVSAAACPKAATIGKWSVSEGDLNAQDTGCQRKHPRASGHR